MIRATAISVQSGLEHSPRKVIGFLHSFGGTVCEVGAKVPGKLRSYFVSLADESGYSAGEFIIRIRKLY